jgi:hypothetical protein
MESSENTVARVTKTALIVDLVAASTVDSASSSSQCLAQLLGMTGGRTSVMSHGR